MSVVATLAKLIPSGIATAYNLSGDVCGGCVGQANLIWDISDTIPAGMSVVATLAKLISSGMTTIPTGMSMVAMLAKLILLGIATVHNPCGEVRSGNVGQGDPVENIQSTQSQRERLWWPR